MAGKRWVLLVAGSHGWNNYKDQANVCAAYQIIKKTEKYNIPDEQIVVMMYDDIANNEANPEKGTILSAVKDLHNVYPGVPKDYTGQNLTKDNFLAALTGKATGKKVINSGPDDNIFIYMCGLGISDRFDFPDKPLTATEIIRTINEMSTQQKFSSMAIYMDSDYSATMFQDNLPNNVCAVTSSDKTHVNNDENYNQSLKLCVSDPFSSAMLNLIYVEDIILGMVYEYLIRVLEDKPCMLGDQCINAALLSTFL